MQEVHQIEWEHILVAFEHHSDEYAGQYEILVVAMLLKQNYSMQYVQM
jgi:hypothetical protein